MLEFIEKARIGEPLPNETVIRIARLFKDEMTLANIARPQLVSMCQYMNLAPYGSDSILRFQLKHKFRNIRRVRFFLISIEFLGICISSQCFE